MSDVMASTPAEKDDNVYELAVVAIHTPSSRGTKRKDVGEINCSDGKRRKITIDSSDLLDFTIIPLLQDQTPHCSSSTTSTVRNHTTDLEFETHFWQLLAKSLTLPSENSHHKATVFRFTVDALWENYTALTPEEFLAEIARINDFRSKRDSRFEEKHVAYIHAKCQEALGKAALERVSYTLQILERAAKDFFKDGTLCQECTASYHRYINAIKDDKSTGSIIKQGMACRKSIVTIMEELETHLSSRELPATWTGCSYFHEDGSKKGNPHAKPPTANTGAAGEQAAGNGVPSN